MRRYLTSTLWLKTFCVILWTVFEIGVTSDVECLFKLEENLNFVLTTERNETGHWAAQLRLQHALNGSNETTQKVDHPVEVQLIQNTNVCLENAADVIVDLSTPPTIRQSPGPEYRLLQGFGYYKRHMKKKPWNEAKVVCEKEGTHLVIINSVEEAVLMMELSARYIYGVDPKTWNNEAYVGIADHEHEGKFKTVFGEPLENTGYLAWARGEPNNYSEEDCVSVLRNMLYNDKDCDIPLEFICELEI